MRKVEARPLHCELRDTVLIAMDNLFVFDVDPTPRLLQVAHGVGACHFARSIGTVVAVKHCHSGLHRCRRIVNPVVELRHARHKSVVVPIGKRFGEKEPVICVKQRRIVRRAKRGPLIGWLVGIGGWGWRGVNSEEKQ